jgi:hypothetical protein
VSVGVEGGGPTAVAVQAKPTDLNQIARQNRGHADPLAVERVVNGAAQAAYPRIRSRISGISKTARLCIRSVAARKFA